MRLVDQFGRAMDSLKGIGKFLRPAENIFEGIINISLYDDAISMKGTCAHCMGPMEGVLRFPEGYRLHDADMEQDARQQIIEKVRREHFCIARIQGPKLPVRDWLKRFE